MYTNVFFLSAYKNRPQIANHLKKNKSTGCCCCLDLSEQLHPRSPLALRWSQRFLLPPACVFSRWTVKLFERRSRCRKCVTAVWKTKDWWNDILRIIGNHRLVETRYSQGIPETHLSGKFADGSLAQKTIDFDRLLVWTCNECPPFKKTSDT